MDFFRPLRGSSPAGQGRRNLSLRIWSSVFIIGLILGLYIFLKDSGLRAFAYACQILCSLEFSKMILAPKDWPRRHHEYVLGFSLICFFWVGRLFPGQPELNLLLWTSFLIYSVVHWRNSPHGTKKTLDFFMIYLLGSFYLGFLPLYVLLIIDKSWSLFFLFVGIVSGGDILAYIGGKGFGKTPLAPSISPGKTIEGTVTALFGSLLIVFLYQALGGRLVSHWLLGVGFLTSVAAQIGDLFESCLKRECGLKDSGDLLPGHGGILDRLDGILLAAPVFYWGLKFAN